MAEKIYGKRKVLETMGHSNRIMYGYINDCTMSIEQQKELLIAHGVDPTFIYEESPSTTPQKKPVFQELNAVMREGDTLVVGSIAAFRIEARAILRLLNRLKEKHIRLVCLKESIDSAAPSGEVLYNALSAIYPLPAHSQGYGIVKPRGRNGGRPRIDKQNMDKAVRLYMENILTIKEICTAAGISNKSLYRELARREIQRPHS